MNKKQIINKLGLLRGIEPGKDFTQKSRLIIVQMPFTPTINDEVSLVPVNVGLRNYSVGTLFSNGFRSILMVSATIAVLAGIYFATTQLSPLFLPGLNQRGVVAEADMINAAISVHFSPIDKFEQTTKESADALKEVTTDAPSHLNSTVIKNEQSKVDSAFTTDPQSQNNEDVSDILKILSP
jgi:hypothetical protein